MNTAGVPIPIATGPAVLSRSQTRFENAFLGMLQFDLGNYEAAADWLDNRLLQIEGTQRWQAHARYLLGRCSEAQNAPTEAVGWYKQEGVPQGSRQSHSYPTARPRPTATEIASISIRQAFARRSVTTRLAAIVRNGDPQLECAFIQASDNPIRRLLYLPVISSTRAWRS